MKNQTIKDDVIDIEEYCLSEKHPPHEAKKFLIKIDNQKYLVDRPEMTGHEILALVGKDSKRCQLREKFCGKFVTIAPDQVVKFTTPGIERFTTLCSDVTDGGLVA